MVKHNRFYRKVWASKSDFTGALAMWLVKQSPYIVPDNLSVCIIKFYNKLDEIETFDELGMAEVELSTLTSKVDSILESIPEIVQLNERKNKREGIGFSSRYSKKPEPDDDFIDITAVAQDITCCFAEREDAQCWLDKDKTD